MTTATVLNRPVPSDVDQQDSSTPAPQESLNSYQTAPTRSITAGGVTYVYRVSEDLHRRIPGSGLVIYPDSGHSGIFQFHDQFAPVAVAFLDR